MSHSRILVLNNSDYDVDSMLEEMRSYGNGVDYIDDNIKTSKEDFDWFMDYVSDMGFIRSSEEELKFRIESADTFWSKMTEDVKQIMERDGGINAFNKYNIESRISMKEGFWIQVDECLYTLPFFVKFYGSLEKVFTVTKILDYHM